MTACTRNAVAMFTDVFSSDAIAATARRTGFVKRTAKITGKIFLALITFGVWNDAATTRAPWAAQRAVSPEAMYQRMHTRALAFLHDLIGQALPKVPALEPVCAAALLPAFPKVSLAESTSFELPTSLHDLLSGSGGSATQAGAKMQAVWAYKRSGFAHFALTPWNLPAQQDGALVVA